MSGDKEDEWTIIVSPWRCGLQQSLSVGARAYRGLDMVPRKGVVYPFSTKEEEEYEGDEREREEDDEEEKEEEEEGEGEEKEDGDEGEVMRKVTGP